MKRKLTDTNVSISTLGRAEKYWQGRNVKSKFSAAAKTADDVDLMEILHYYSLKGFEFGNWLNNDERYDHVLACKEALHNLAWVMHTHNIGFDRQIGIAFGARGTTGALAHYECYTNMINLTKKNGHQSLAHEYGHALDWNFGRYVDQNKHYNWLTGSMTSSSAFLDNTGGQFRHYANAIVDTIKKTDSYASVSGEYWCRRNEIFARAFEQYVCYCIKSVAKSGASTRYLCKSWSYYTGSKNYLSESDFKKVLPFFKLLVAEFGKYMNGNGALRAMPYYMVQPKAAEPLKKAAQTAAKPKTAPKPKAAPKPKIVVSGKKITQAQAAGWLYTLVKMKKDRHRPADAFEYQDRIMYTANGSMVATDGHVMAYIPADNFGSTPTKNVVVCNDGHRTTTFPKNWNSIWPKSLSKPVVLDIAAELKRTPKQGIRNYSEKFEYYEKAGYRFDKTRYKRAMTFLKHFGRECLFEASTAKNKPSKFSVGTVKLILMPLAE